MRENLTPTPQAPERVSNLVKNFADQQEYLCNSDVSGPISAPALTPDEWSTAYVTLAYRLYKTPKDDPEYALLERLCKKIAPALAEGFGS